MLAAYFQETICIPNQKLAAPENMVLFTDIRKFHCGQVLVELDMHQVPFSRTKTNNEGKHVKVGVKDLFRILKLSLCPNEEVEI